MRENKAEYIKKMEELLKSDYRSEVETIDYAIVRREEIVTITFKCGYIKKLRVTGNSNFANLKAVTEEVY